MGLFRNLFRSTHARGGFPVDDVTPSAKRRSTTTLNAALREKLSRPVLVSPMEAHRVLAWEHASHPLVTAVHLAFSQHLPLVLSPDAVWLTVLQGFSHHITDNAEAFRGRLVRHQGRVDLKQEIKELNAEQVAEAVAGFSSQIRQATDPAIHDALVCDFTTTTPEARTASEVALMDTYSHYFTFSFEQIICGIPWITLTGSPADWQRIRERIELLETFGLDWWVPRLRPILDEFSRAANGQPDREFWRNIYKVQVGTQPYDPTFVTGWITDLFPYLGDAPKRHRNPVLEESADRRLSINAFPSGLTSVQVILRLLNDNRDVLQERELDLVAGLLGVEQAQEDGAVSPLIGWALAECAPAQEKRPTFQGRPLSP